MADSKHTPGPWHPGHLGSDSSCQCRYVLDEGHAGGICTVHVDNGKRISDGGNDAPSREQAIANMHLIAAAPDLLLTGKHLFVKLAEVYRATGQKMTDCQAIRDWLEAVAKAEGRS